MRSLLFSPAKLAAAAAIALSLGFAGCEPAKTRSLPDPGPNAATLTLTSQPPGAQLTVDGVTVGKAPQTVKVKAGLHRVKAVMSGYFPLEQSFSMDADGTKTVDLPLVASH